MSLSKKQTIVALVWLGLFFGLSNVYAVGMAIKPNKINIDTTLTKTATAEILISNVSDQGAIYQAYPDDLKKNIKISPNNFQLNPGQSQIATITTKINWPGEFMTTLSVVATPLQAGGLTAGTGVKIPVYITVSGMSELWIGLGFFLLFILIIATKRKQQTL